MNDERLEKPIVLVVDDTPDNLSLMSLLLKDLYRVKVANNGALALKIVERMPQPDIILLDIMMPEMDGYEVLRRLRANPAARSIPVIFLTAKSSIEDEKTGLDLGAADYITKPISPPIVLARIRNHLQLKAAADFLKDKALFLAQEVERRTLEVQAIQDVTILAMASLAETRDNDTGNHIRRTQHYVRLLALELQQLPKFESTLTDEAIELLFKSAPLHDIGKVGIPDAVLLKPGPLTAEEFEVMKTHTTIGHNAILAAERTLAGNSDSFLRFAREIALSHQEKWDGSGYPEGLRGEEIPISGRLMAIADVYDALICKRVYKPAFSHADALRIIMDGKGRHFDPDMVDAFERIAERFHEVALRFAD